MKGLLQKEIYIFREQIKSWLIALAIMVVFMIVLGTPVMINTYYMLIAVMSAMTTFSLDKACEWDSYALCLPVTRKLMVKSKYLLVLVIDVSVGAFSLLCGLGYALITGSEPAGEVFLTFGALTIFVVLAQMTLLPVIYRWGVEKSRYIFIAVCAVPFFIFYIVKDSLAQMTQADWLFFIAFMLAVTAASIPVSYLSSVKIYGKQEI